MPLCRFFADGGWATSRELSETCTDRKITSINFNIISKSIYDSDITKEQNSKRDTKQNSLRFGASAPRYLDECPLGYVENNYSRTIVRKE